MIRLVFCAALPQEVHILCKRLLLPTPHAQNQVSDSVTQSGVPIRIIVSGVGENRMKTLLKRLPWDETPNHWYSIGFAVGLHPSLHAGDCLNGSTLLSENSRSELNHSSTFSSPDSQTAVLYCQDRPVLQGQEKARMHEQTGADLLDMESAAVAEFARNRQENFSWIKTVSDTAEEQIPPSLIECINPKGFPSTLRALRVLLFHPNQIAFFMRMGLRSHQCGVALADSILRLLAVQKK